jgi:hypothetical protein
MRIFSACIVLSLIAVQAIPNLASAGECIRRPDRFELRSDTAYWTITIGVGGECLQGLRGRAMLLDSVRVVEPPKTGLITISGPSFRYSAPATPGSDSFKLEVSGEDRRIRGKSIIQVEVVAR